MEEKILTLQNEIHPNMLMDVIILKLEAGEERIFYDDKNETAFLLLTGKARVEWQNKDVEVHRTSIFDEKPYCLHVPKETEVIIIAREETEFLIQRTFNDNKFESIMYTPEMLEERILGGDQVKGTAKRLIRDIFLYDNAPYSNMVLGELVHYPGKWSSWPPHSHEQPEVYYYKFDKPQGFGISVVDETATIVRDGDFAVIPGGVVHPQVAAPGYAMYYTWMIRHFDGNPWTTRDFAKEHEWQLDPNAVIWDK